MFPIVYPIVYGARLKVKEGQAVEQGQVLVEWDPYTFSILTEDPGQIKFKDILERMADAMAHRGPDGQGTWVSGGVGLAHRRLAIIDLVGGRQPMVSDDRQSHAAAQSLSSAVPAHMIGTIEP